MRYYLGVDWADKTHAVWRVDEQGTKVASRLRKNPSFDVGSW